MNFLNYCSICIINLSKNVHAKKKKKINSRGFFLPGGTVLRGTIELAEVRLADVEEVWPEPAHRILDGVREDAGHREAEKKDGVRLDAAEHLRAHALALPDHHGGSDSFCDGELESRDETYGIMGSRTD